MSPIAIGLIIGLFALAQPCFTFFSYLKEYGSKFCPHMRSITKWLFGTFPTGAPGKCPGFKCNQQRIFCCNCRFFHFYSFKEYASKLFPENVGTKTKFSPGKKSMSAVFCLSTVSSNLTDSVPLVMKIRPCQFE